MNNIIKDKLLKLRDKLFAHKNSNKIAENQINNKSIDYTIIKDIINVKFEENLVFIEIKDNCKFYDYVKTIDECYGELNKIFLPMKVFVTNGGNIMNWILYKQKIYIFKYNNYDYMISVSDNEIKISQTILRDNLYHETELIYKNNEKKYTVYKLIHDLNRSTKCPKWYPEEENNNFYLDKDEAFSMLEDLFINLNKIDNIKDIIEDLDEIEEYIKNDFGNKKKLLK